MTRKKTILNREQKTGFGMVAGFGALALVFGVFYLWKHVASPFVLSYTGPKFLTGDERRQEEMETLRKEDTDGDGLDDYSELYVYRTSPYIADSDSDGLSDSTEIQSGADPNCAPTMPCDSAADTINPTTLKGTFIEAQVQATAAAGTSEAPSVEANVDDLAAALDQMSSDELRKLLIDAGGDVASVNALTDDELRTAMAQALQQLQIQQGETTNSDVVSETNESSDSATH